jgi:hypothetical protein
MKKATKSEPLDAGSRPLLASTVLTDMAIPSLSLAPVVV